MLDLKVIPAYQVIIAIVIMKGLTMLLPNLDYSFLYTNQLAILIAVIAIIIGLTAVFNFKSHKTTVNPSTPEKASKVVNSGIFAYSRNPMYLALLLVLIAVAIKLQNSASFIVLPLFLYYITQFQIKPEEKALKKLFNNDYQVYCQKVRRWL